MFGRLIVEEVVAWAAALTRRGYGVQHMSKTKEKWDQSIASHSNVYCL